MALPGGKWQAPVARRRLVPRPRVLQNLQVDGPLPRLALVCAPAGFGKTTALTQWLASWRSSPADRPRHVAWLSIEATDDDPRRLLAGLVTALGHALPGAGIEAGQLLENERADPDLALAALVADLEALAADVVLALDDYHLVESAPAHALITRLADSLPPHAALAMATRADPALPLARWRARGELAELRAADLRFTPAEASELLNGVMGLELSGRQVEVLQGRTEGWAAGLQLAAVSLRGRDDPEEFVDRFAGSHRFVLDYLVEEVLDALDDDTRAFLVDTCVLDRLTGPLCDAITGRTGARADGQADGQARLEALEATNLFVVPLDDERAWYRYHHLFAEALRARGAATDPERQRRSHRAAAKWFDAHGEPDAAIGHAVHAGDLALAAHLVEAALPEASRRRLDRTMYRWIALLPEAEIAPRPALQVAAAWARLGAGDVVGAQERLAAAEALLTRADTNHPETRRLLLTIAMYRAAVAQAGEDVPGTQAQARRVVELAGPDEHLPRGAGLGFLGMAAWAQGRLPEAIEAFTECARSLRLAGNLTDELGCTVPLALMWRDRGRPDEAARLLRRALDRAESAGAAGAPVRADLLVGLAACELDAADAGADLDVPGVVVGDRREGHLAAADAHLTAAHALGETASLPENRFRWFEVSARLREARGDLDGARHLLEEAQARYLPGFFPDLKPLSAQIARIDLARGRLDLARDWARRAGIADTEPSYRRTFEHVTYARLLAEIEAAGGALSGGAPSSEAPGGKALSEQSLPEPLSERERDVLRLLATELAGPQIAAQLYVSLNTLRTHTRHIFTKLDVGTRAAAVRRGRELGLL